MYSFLLGKKNSLAGEDGRMTTLPPIKVGKTGEDSRMTLSIIKEKDSLLKLIIISIFFIYYVSYICDIFDMVVIIIK